MTAARSNGRADTTGVFDLSAAASAAIAEAEGRPFVFAFAGDMYELPNQKLWPLTATDALADPEDGGNMKEFFRAIGAKDGTYERLVGAGMRMAHLDTLMTQATKDAGLGDTKNSSRPLSPAPIRT